MNSKHDSGDHMRFPKVHNPLYLVFAAVYYALAANVSRKWVQEYKADKKGYRFSRLSFSRLWVTFVLSFFGGAALKASTMDTSLDGLIEDNDSAEGTLGDVNYILNCLDEMDTEGMNDENTFRIHGVTTTLEQIRADLLAQRGDILVPDRKAWDNETGDGLAAAQRADHLLDGKINLFDLEDDELGRLTQAARAWMKEQGGAYPGSGDPTPLILRYLSTIDAEELTMIITGEPSTK